MQYKFPMTLDRQFKNKLENLHNKYGTEMMKIEGMSPEQLDTCQFFANFIEHNTIADATIDDNANVTNKHIGTMLKESNKPFTKLLSRNKIYIEIKEEFGVEVANEFLEKAVNGEIYEHDSHSSSFMPYCYAFSLNKIVMEGLYFLDEMAAGRPKHWDTFNHHTLEFISYATNQQAGAVGIPDYLVYAYYFYKKDTENMSEKESERYLNQKFQEFIYNLNQPYLKGGVQSAYSNVSILDREHLKGFFEGKNYPNGDLILNHTDEIIKFQKSFLDYVGELRKEKWHTFPVISASLVYKNGEYKDKETAKMIVNHNWKFGFNDINIMRVDEVTSAASCCFGKDQKVLTRSRRGVDYKTFKELDESSWKESKDGFKIFHNGSWVEGKIVKIPKGNKDVYKVTTSNNKELIMTDDHTNVTFEGEKKTSELSVKDYLMFNTKELNTYPEKDLGLSYEQGILIGAYLGDGSIDFSDTGNSARINFSLNKEKYENLLPLLEKSLEDTNINASINLSSPYNNVYPAYVNSIDLANFIKAWTSGKYGHEKELNLDCLTQCVDFRKGILDGYYMTDGGNSNRIYTTSEKLAQQTEVLITSLGFNSTIDMTDRTDEKVIIRGEEFKRNYPLYCIRWYDSGNKRSMKNVYKYKNNSVYFKIKSIKKVDYEDSYVYCFEMDNEDESYFTLPNGVITHNCRLTSNTKEIGEGDTFNSIGGSDLNIGSTKVVDHNLVRLAILSDNKAEFYQRVKENTKLIHKYHYCHRKILNKLIDKGLLPMYSSGMMDLDRQFATVGIGGVYEAVKVLGGIEEDKQGVFYTNEGYEIAEKMFKMIKEENKNTFDKYGFKANIEQSPNESAAVKLNKKDRMMFGNRQVNKLLGEDCYIYGNQWIPLKENTSIFRRIDAAKLDEHCGGGAILHLNLGENFNSFEDAWEFEKGLARKGVKYSSLISLIDICEEDHSFFGDTCPICGNKSISKGIKIVGYLVKQDSYKEERKQELSEREFYKLN